MLQNYFYFYFYFILFFIVYFLYSSSGLTDEIILVVDNTKPNPVANVET